MYNAWHYPFNPLFDSWVYFKVLIQGFFLFFYHVQEYPNPGLVNCFMSSDRSFFSFLYSLVLVYKYQNRDHYICNFKCHRQKKYTMAFKANKPHGYQYTENRALTVQNLFVVSVRHCLTFLRPPQDLLPRPCKFSTSGRGSFDIPTSCSSASCSRLWNLSKREICQKSFYFFLISVW